MDATLIAIVALLALIATALVATARVVRLDRPASPPRSSSGDWRDEALGWDRLGIS